MAQFEYWMTTDLKRGSSQVHALHGQTFTQDNLGNRVGVIVLDGGRPATLNGAVTGYVIRADGGTVVVAGTVDGSKAYIDLPESAYAVPGQIQIAIRLISGETKTVLGALNAYVRRTATGTIIDPGHVIPDIDDIIAKMAEVDAKIAETDSAIDAAEAATVSANNATKYIAETEATSTASAAHAVGSDFIYNGKLMKATSAIAPGATIVPYASGVPNYNCAEVPNGLSGDVYNVTNTANAAANNAADAQQLVASLESFAGMPTGPATKAHATGSYFVFGGALYIATADIAIGDDIVTTGTGANAVQAPGGAMGEVADLKSVLEQIEENTPNLWIYDRTITFTKSRVIDFNTPLPENTYTISAAITSSDVDGNLSRVIFKNSNNENIVCDLTRGDRASYTFTSDYPIIKATFYAGVGPTTSEGDEAKWEDIQIQIGSESTEYVVPGLSAVDIIARASTSSLEKQEKTKLVSISNCRMIYGVISSGKWVNVSNKNRSLLIAPENFKTVTIIANENRGTKLTFLKSDKYAYENSNADIVDGTDTIIINSGQTRTYNIPEGTKYICITIMSALNDTTPESIELKNNNSILNELDYEIKTENEYASSIKNETLDGLERLDKSFCYIAYSGITASGHAMNSKEFFAWAAMKPIFACVKGDIRPTLDNKIVMCHDPAFTLNGSGNIITYDASSQNNVVIHNENKSTLLQLTYASTGENVCDFEDYIKICKKYGKWAFITIRDEYITDILEYMFDVINRQHMINYVIFNSATPGTLQAIRAYSSNVICSYLRNSGSLPLTNDDIDFAHNLGKCLVTIASVDVSGESQNVLDYALSKKVRLYGAGARVESEIDGLINSGFTGCQMYYVPYESN